MNDAQTALALRLLQQGLKILLLALSVKLPKLIPAVAVDGLVDQLAPWVASLICLGWSVAQHYLDQEAKRLAVQIAAAQAKAVTP